MRFRDKIGPLHDPILKPAILPDFLAVARIAPLARSVPALPGDVRRSLAIISSASRRTRMVQRS